MAPFLLDIGLLDIGGIEGVEVLMGQEWRDKGTRGATEVNLRSSQGGRDARRKSWS